MEHKKKAANETRTLLEELSQRTAAAKGAVFAISEEDLFLYYANEGRILGWLKWHADSRLSCLVLRFFDNERLARRVHEWYLDHGLPAEIELDERDRFQIAFRWP